MNDKLEIQYISDIHLEFLGNSRFIEIPIIAPFLALVGDIGYPSKAHYSKFLKWCSEKYQKVFLIAGNHEYYDLGDMEKTERKMLELVEDLKNVYYLNDDIYEFSKDSKFKDYVILGATLWSHIPFKHFGEVYKNMMDYRKISINKEQLKIEFTNELHAVAKDFLEDEINKAKENGKKVIILTHHAPLKNGTSPPEYEQEGDERALNHAFVSDLSELMGDPVVAWIFGHTHWTCDFDYKGTRVVTNAIGYRYERFDVNLDTKIEI